MKRKIIITLSMIFLSSLNIRAEEISITAGEIEYNANTHQVKAKKNVKIATPNSLIKTKEIKYDTKEDTLFTEERVTIIDKKTNKKSTVNGLSAKSDLSEVNIHDVRLNLGDNVRIIAQDAEKTEKKLPSGRKSKSTKFENVTYTACEIEECGHPTWQLDADEIVRLEDTKDIIIYHSILKIHDVPVFYMPFLSLPEPTVKRKTGFLFPEFGSTEATGFYTKVPYYININDTHDLTLTPTYTSDSNMMAFLEHRKHFSFGKSITNASGADKGLKEENIDYRWHVFSYNTANLTDTLRTNLNIEETSDDEYLDDYDISGKLWLENEINIERLIGRNYAYLKAKNYDDLRDYTDEKETPQLVPQFEINTTTLASETGAFFNYKLNGSSLEKENEEFSQRVSAEISYNHPLIFNSGLKLTNQIKLRGDSYNVKNYLEYENAEEYSEYRFYPNLSTALEFPLYQERENSYQLFNPIIQFVASQKDNNPAQIPNEDSIDFEFDDGNLMSSNKFTGYDLVNEGLRLNYGLSWSAYGKKFGKILSFIGQSINLDEDETYPDTSTLNQEYSDIVGRIYIYPNKHFKLKHRFRLDKETLKYKKNETSLNISFDRFEIGGDYIYFKEESGFTNIEPREEVIGHTSIGITKNWRTSLSHKYDIIAKEDIYSKLSLNYKNDCFEFKTDVSNDYEEDELTFGFKIYLKTIGEYGTNTIE